MPHELTWLKTVDIVERCLVILGERRSPPFSQSRAGQPWTEKKKSQNGPSTPFPGDFLWQHLRPMNDLS
jgi:hypothetical protein